MPQKSKRLTYSALTVAVAVVCIIISQFTPLKSPLFLAALCFYVALEKCGLGYGLLSIAASIVLILIMGFLAAGILVIIVFAPYAIMHFFMRNLCYNNAWHVLVRVVVTIVFANLVYFLVYQLAHQILPEIDLNKVTQLVGGYYVLAFFTTVFFLVTDYFFRQIYLIIRKINI